MQFSGGFMNKYFGWAVASVLSVTGIGSAIAADMPLKALPPPVVPFSWTGFYVGGFVGGAGTDSVSSPDGTNPSTVVGGGGAVFLSGTPAVCDGGTPGLKTGCVANYGMGSSVIAGGTAGYNWQFGKTVAGLEGEFGYMHLSGSGVLPFIAGAACGSVANPCVASFSTIAGNWFGTITGRLGITADALNPAWSNHLLLYAKGGAAVTRLGTSETIVPGPFSAGFAQFTGTSTIWGWAAGAGAEWAFSQHWSVKAEYEFLGFNKSATGCGILPLGAAGAGGTWCTSSGINGIQTGKVGVNYRF